MGSNYQHVFTPLTLKGIEFKNRIECAPTVPELASEDGCFTPELLAYHRAFARGGASIVTVGNASINMGEARDEFRQIDLSADKVIIGLHKYVEMCAGYGAIASIEVNHSGRSAPVMFNKRAPFGPSPISEKEILRAREKGVIPQPIIEMDLDKIAETIDAYAEACLRCQKAGFKMVMLHGAHNNLLAQFLSPLSNQRKDQYGGKLENRARFALEVITAVRKKCGNDLVIEYRFGADEIAEEGLHQEEALEFAKMIEDQIDILHVSAGMVHEPQYTKYMIQPMYMPRMLNVHFAETFKKELKVPIATVGSIMNLDNAEMILANGWADLVALARPFMADPEILRKSAHGRPEDVCPCIRCSYHGRVVKNKTVGCAVNPFCGRETEFPSGRVDKAPVPKKVVVVGGGPAGMQAARTAVERGHQVVLFEKSGSLGGMLQPATVLPFKEDLRDYLTWAVRQTEKCGAEIRLKAEGTPENVAREQPEALILAAGAIPIIPHINGIDRPNVCWAGDADSGKSPVGENVVVVGGGVVGFESGLHLAQNGKKVTIIEMVGEDKLLKGEGLLASFSYSLYDRAIEAGVRVKCHTRLEEVTETGVVCQDLLSQSRTELACDSVVLALGLRPRRDVVEALRHLIPETEIYIVGDAAKPENLGTAVNSAFAAASAI